MTKKVEKVELNEEIQKPDFVTHEMFVIIKNDHTEGMYKILVGGHLASAKGFKTIKAAKDYINQKPWDLLTSCMCAIVANMGNVQQSNN